MLCVCLCVRLYMYTHFFRRIQVRYLKTAKLILESKSKVANGTVNWHKGMFSCSFLEVAKFIKSKRSKIDCANAFNTNLVFRVWFLRSQIVLLLALLNHGLQWLLVLFSHPWHNLFMDIPAALVILLPVKILLDILCPKLEVQQMSILKDS